MKRLLLVVGSFALTGCVGAAWDTRPVPAPAPIASDGTRWQQYCTYNGTSDLDELNAWLRGQGEQGWELATMGARNVTMYCFKRRIAAR